MKEGVTAFRLKVFDKRPRCTHVGFVKNPVQSIASGVGLAYFTISVRIMLVALQCRLFAVLKQEKDFNPIAAAAGDGLAIFGKKGLMAAGFFQLVGHFLGGPETGKTDIS